MKCFEMVLHQICCFKSAFFLLRLNKNSFSSLCRCGFHDIQFGGTCVTSVRGYRIRLTGRRISHAPILATLDGWLRNACNVIFRFCPSCASYITQLSKSPASRAPRANRMLAAVSGVCSFLVHVLSTFCVLSCGKRADVNIRSPE
jgi:hypothetical protein